MTWILGSIAVYAFVRWMVEDNDHANTSKAFLVTAADLLRAEQRITELEAAVACRDEEISNLEAHLRRQQLFVVGADDPLPVVPTDPAARIALGIAAAREAAGLDAEWAALDGKDGA